MAIDALVKPLLQLPLFRGLKPMQITEIVRRADRIVYRPGDVIIEEHAEADAAIVLVEGEAVRVSGPDLSVGRSRCKSDRCWLNSECSSRHSIRRRSWRAPRSARCAFRAPKSTR